jgi:hypothetical protein
VSGIGASSEVIEVTATCKLLENEAVDGLGWRPRAEALEVLLRDRAPYLSEQDSHHDDPSRSGTPGSDLEHSAPEA